MRVSTYRQSTLEQKIVFQQEISHIFTYPVLQEFLSHALKYSFKQMRILQRCFVCSQIIDFFAFWAWDWKISQHQLKTQPILPTICHVRVSLMLLKSSESQLVSNYLLMTKNHCFCTRPEA